MNDPSRASLYAVCLLCMFTFLHVRFHVPVCVCVFGLDERFRLCCSAHFCSREVRAFPKQCVLPCDEHMLPRVLRCFSSKRVCQGRPRLTQQATPPVRPSHLFVALSRLLWQKHSMFSPRLTLPESWRIHV